ncbi:DUF3027 domain-containing protein [Cellulomonas humilata]|uniref:DUF3027 domain-containing protein n=1 Tax=Cellulomonas humilata TaxID=144055 RepID=A0ABU0EAB0_9CELL|nr:DUF3027 domain-containing protein [Cellulomonas humilata]MDQ0372122.1 hypothetical protein [Cellulomonas humilata]
MPAATKDAVLGSAVDLAREVAVGLAEDPSDVGEYLGLVVEGERLVSHRFASAARGYRGWEWTVTVARVPRGRTATVCEAELLPGPDAVLGQAWLPWSERIRPGDIGPGDVLPFKADDPRLEPGWTPTGDPELDDVAIDELALARVRVLSPEGRDEAAERWYRGPHGPTSAGSLASAAACGSCGFLVPLRGSLGTVFGVCANQWSPDDGVVVSVDHGCGAHSETDAEAPPTDWPAPDPLIDELSLETVQLTQPAAEAQPEAPQADEAPSDEGPSDVVATDEVATDEASTDEVAVDEVSADGAASADVATDETQSEPSPVAEPQPDEAPTDDAGPDSTSVDSPESTDAPDDTTTSDSADESPARPDPEP